jgi:hypothetical protein
MKEGKSAIHAQKPVLILRISVEAGKRMETFEKELFDMRRKDSERKRRLAKMKFGILELFHEKETNKCDWNGEEQGTITRRR